MPVTQFRKFQVIKFCYCCCCFPFSLTSSFGTSIIFVLVVFILFHRTLRLFHYFQSVFFPLFRLYNFCCTIFKFTDCVLSLILHFVNRIDRWFTRFLAWKQFFFFCKCSEYGFIIRRQNTKKGDMVICPLTFKCSLIL